MTVRRLEPVVLVGREVTLRPLAVEHLPGLIDAVTDGTLWNLHVTLVPAPEGMAAVVEAALRAQARGDELPFAIVHTATGRVLGSTRFLRIALEHRRLEIGHTWLRASAQRTAANTEAKLLLLTHAFEALECNRVEFVTDVLNARSRAALERIGATQEGVLRSHMVMRDGRVRDSALFSVVRSEWPAVAHALREKLSRTA